MLACKGLIFYLAIVIISEDFGNGIITTAAKNRGSCPDITGFPGKVKYKRRGTKAQFRCPKGAIRYGQKFLICQSDNTWNGEPPVCIRPGCVPIDISSQENLDMTEKNGGALLQFSCENAYQLIGAKETFCDGVRWSAPLPSCTATADLTECDFETDLCGWSQETENDQRDWTRNIGSTLTGDTGPKHDHTEGESGNGHYMFFESSNPAVGNDEAWFVSPKYASNMSPACFDFWYHMYGPDDQDMVGSLSVYVRGVSQFIEEVSPEFHKEGNQGNVWKRGNIQVKEQGEDFQIVIIGIRKLSYFSDIAFDDVRLYNCSENTTDSTTEPLTESTTTIITTETPTPPPTQEQTSASKPSKQSKTTTSTTQEQTSAPKPSKQSKTTTSTTTHKKVTKQTTKPPITSKTTKKATTTQTMTTKQRPKTRKPTTTMTTTTQKITTTPTTTTSITSTTTTTTQKPTTTTKPTTKLTTSTKLPTTKTTVPVTKAQSTKPTTLKQTPELTTVRPTSKPTTIRSTSTIHVTTTKSKAKTSKTTRPIAKTSPATATTKPPTYVSSTASSISSRKATLTSALSTNMWSTSKTTKTTPSTRKAITRQSTEPTKASTSASFSSDGTASSSKGSVGTTESSKNVTAVPPVAVNQRETHPEDDTLKPLMIGLGVGIIAGLIIIGIVAWVCVRRRKFYTRSTEDELKPITNSESVHSLNNIEFYNDEEYESES